jgi:DsbC/DsbD-like thiol-disulfide interchange protein
MMAMVTLRSDAYSSRFVAQALVLLTALATPLTLQATEIASAWSEGKTETKARLIAGTSASKTVAAVEIQLADGWKTYWRFPGDGGGVPPMFDWGKSDNVASVRVLYPRPKRFADTAGDTLGYKGLAVFPLIVEPKDATKPVTLKLALDYGICREVCVPVEAALAIDIPVSGTTEMPAHILAAIDHVPRAGQELRANDPRVTKVEVKLDGAAPSLAIEADYPGGIADADAYIESPEGFYIPLPKVGSAKEVGKNRLRFEIDLTGAVDPADIKGKDAKVTLVSDKGLSETTFKLE